jgi:serine O-acetyltransferase
MCGNTKFDEKENPSLKNLLLTDYRLNSKKSFLVLFFYRVCHFLFVRKYNFLLLLLSGIQGLIYFFLRINTQISYEAIIGSNIRLPHCAMGVVISSRAIIGNNITIYHQVTIGVNESKPEEKKQIVISDNCYLSTGCIIISCKIGRNCKIAPNAVVYKDIPDNTICFPVNNTKIIRNDL